MGGLDPLAEPFGFVPRPAPAPDVATAPDGAALGTMLERGEIDVLFSANVPRTVLDGLPTIRRLFGECEPVERNYFARTGIFSIMHAVVIRRELLAHDRILARWVYEAFSASKDAAAERFRYMSRLSEVQSMLP